MLVRSMGAVALITAICLVTFATPSASAAPAQPEAKMTWGIVTGTLYLNKSETLKLSVGGGAAAAISTILPPPFDLIVLGGGTALAVKAGWAAADGKCLKIKSYGTIRAYGRHDKNGKYCR